MKRDDGIHVKIDSLSELRARITSGELAQSDMISRDGSPWKRLGEIEELRRTFDSARTSVRPMPMRPDPHHAVTSQAARARSETRKDGWAGLDDVPTRRRKLGDQPVAPTPRTAPSAPIAPVATAPRAPAAAAPAAGFTPRPARPRLVVLALHEDELPVRRNPTRLGWVVAVVAIVAVAGLLLWYRARSAGIEAEHREATEAARNSLVSDTYDAYRRAAQSLGERHAENPDALEPVVALAFCESRWSQALADEAAFEADEGRARSLRSLASQHADEAVRFGDRAADMQPATRLSLSAAADAHRVDGDRAGAKALLARSAAAGGDETSETLRVAAQIGLEETRDLAAARAMIGRALELAPADARLILLQARLSVESSDLARASAALERLRGASPSHPGVRYIDAALRERLAEDAGVPNGAER